MPDPLADVKRAFRKFERDMDKAMATATREAAELVLDEMQGLTRAIGYTLEDFRRMGHPYAWDAETQPPTADWITYLQERDLHEGLQRSPLLRSGGRVEAQILSSAPHTWYLLQGTRYMRPRDFATAALLYQEDEVAAIYQRHHARVHDLPGHTPNFRPERVDIPHEQFPAELPEGA